MPPDPLRNTVSRSWKPTPRGIGSLEGHRVLDGHALVEEAVAAQPVPLEARHLAGDVERRVAVLGRAGHPRRLVRRIVGVLVLEDDNLPALPVPDDLVLLVVLDGQ